MAERICFCYKSIIPLLDALRGLQQQAGGRVLNACPFLCLCEEIDSQQPYVHGCRHAPGATTNSDSGVTDLAKVAPAMEVSERLDCLGLEEPWLGLRIPRNDRSSVIPYTLI